MNRWTLTIENYDTKPLIYAETSDKARLVFQGENILSVEPYENIEYLAIVDYIKTKSNFLGSRKTKYYNVQEWYECKTVNGDLKIKLYRDKETYYDIAEYQFKSKDNKQFPLTFIYSTPLEIKELFFAEPLKCEIPVFRIYGEPKMKKPTELKGISSCFSVDWNEKCKCQCFIKNNDLWIKHRDFFSRSHQTPPSDIGTPLRYRMKKYFNVDKAYLDKFIYSDSWGDIVLRNEAWIAFRNFKLIFDIDRIFPIQTLIKAFSESDMLKRNHISELSLSSDWERFFEKLCKEYRKF